MSVSSGLASVTRLVISLIVQAVQGHACGSKAAERVPRKMGTTSTG